MENIDFSYWIETGVLHQNKSWEANSSVISSVRKVHKQELDKFEGYGLMAEVMNYCNINEWHPQISDLASQIKFDQVHGARVLEHGFPLLFYKTRSTGYSQSTGSVLIIVGTLLMHPCSASGWPRPKRVPQRYREPQ